MNADPAVQLRLLDLQAVDTRLDQIAHRRRSLPEAVRVAELEARRTSVADLLVAAETVVSDVQREVDRSERDVQAIRERATKDRALLDSGSVGNAKQLESLTHELESLARRQSDLEDIELEVLERLDGAQAAVAGLSQERAAIESGLVEAVSARDAAYAELDAEAEALVAERLGVAGDIPADLLGLYDRLRADHGGLAAAPLHRGRCEGCSLELTPSDRQRIRDAAADEVLRCEECRRILVRTPESGL